MAPTEESCVKSFSQRAPEGPMGRSEVFVQGGGTVTGEGSDVVAAAQAPEHIGIV